MNLKKITKKLSPDKGMEKKAGLVVDKINNSLKSLRINATPYVGGSLAKGTNLRGDFDIDIFVRFDKKYADKDISSMLGTVLKKFKSVKRVHGSRDYFQLVFDKINFEIVPVINIQKSSDALNVTDVSPLHVEWVRSNIKNLSDEVRLAKQFCKAKGIYGAESYINGFSGYILEILVIHYGGFLKLLKGVSKWKPKQIIDTEHYYSSKDEVLKALNDAKLQSPLIVIDPVQKDRNAAAALNLDTFSKFILYAKQFLKNPSINDFNKPVFSLTSLAKAKISFDAELILLEILPFEGKDDVIGSKLLKVFNHIQKQLELNEFKILYSDWHWDDKVYLWYYVYPKILPKIEKHPGPLVYSEDSHVSKFLSKHKQFIVEDSRIYSLTKRKYKEPKVFVKFLLKTPYVKEKVKKIDLRKI